MQFILQMLDNADYKQYDCTYSEMLTWLEELALLQLLK